MARANAIIPGFSLTNRLLLYASILLAPAQAVSGFDNNCPSNLGFLAYNWYTQIAWYKAARNNQLHALCMVLPHFNIIYDISYFGGITSGNPIMGGLLGCGTVGVLALNMAASWVGWKWDQPAGFGEYKFFFFGWRTLDSNWHKFMLCWQIFDSIGGVALAAAAMAMSIIIPLQSSSDDDDGDERVKKAWTKWGYTLLAVPVGAAGMVLYAWPLVLWLELIMARNHIVSETDWIAVWLFIAQAGAMLVPSCSAYLGCCFRRK